MMVSLGFQAQANTSCASAFESVDNIFDAAKTGNIRAIQAFHKQGVDLNAKDENGSWNTPIHVAAQRPNNLEAIKILVVLGADVNAKNKLGWTPVHSVAQNAELEMLQFLKKSGANTNVETYTGQITPFELARRRKDHKTFAVLAELTKK